MGSPVSLGVFGYDNMSIAVNSSCICQLQVLSDTVDGMNKSANCSGSRSCDSTNGGLALQQTISMIQEGASLPFISKKPVMAGAAKRTSCAVGQARKTFMNIIS
ncbi:hypothetical protein BVC80_8229g4 [Macleaya cordata]|uniref:Uncharacterized protein n=1 Tax=Macleaya cordata TaxID=56857 RepID=A0A200QF98_MACCD|nr:hypothetical protein BVC80_8229g4 [Macleaya cordata]